MRLAVCAEMVFLDLPVTERVRRIAEAGFDAEIWDWTRHDIDALAATGATFSSMTGYLRGDFGDGADELVRTAEQSIARELGRRRRHRSRPDPVPGRLHATVTASATCPAVPRYHRLVLPFSAQTRTANLTRMAEDRSDVLVIGGGITAPASPSTPRRAGCRWPWWRRTTSRPGPRDVPPDWCTAACAIWSTASSAWSGSRCGSAAPCSGWRRTWSGRYRCTCWPTICAAGPRTGSG